MVGGLVTGGGTGVGFKKPLWLYPAKLYLLYMALLEFFL